MCVSEASEWSLSKSQSCNDGVTDGGSKISQLSYRGKIKAKSAAFSQKQSLEFQKAARILKPQH